MKRVNCKRCYYYFVTWESQKPHGCKAFGFKSHLIPSMVVRQSSGTNCQKFMDKFKN